MLRTGLIFSNSKCKPTFQRVVLKMFGQALVQLHWIITVFTQQWGYLELRPGAEVPVFATVLLFIYACCISIIFNPKEFLLW